MIDHTIGIIAGKCCRPIHTTAESATVLPIQKARMHLFSHQHATRPTRLLLACLLGLGLAACGGESSDALVDQAKSSIAKGDTKAAIIQLKNAVAADEKNAAARYQLGKLYLEAGDAASAEKELKRAREAGYAADAVNPLLARALIKQGEFQRVLDELPAPAGETQAAAAMLTMRATAELALGRKDAARKGLEQAQKLAPHDPNVQLALARLALADNDTEQAMRAIDQALQADPANRDGMLLKGDLLRATRQPAKAAEVYRAALKADPGNVDARLALATMALEENRLADARAEVSAALKVAPKNLHARYTQAQIEFRDKKFEAARDQLAAVLKTAPNFAPALLLGGAIEYALGNLQTAEAYLNKVVKAAPANVYAVRLLAATQLRLGRADDAASTLAPALKAAPQDAGVQIVAGEIALAKKAYSEASEHFEAAAKLSPGSAVIRTELGLARLAQGDSRAMADLHTAAGMEGGGGRADTLIILSQLNNKQYDAALASIAALEKKQPASPLTWNYRGAAYMGKQDVARARDSFGQALKLDPAFFPAAANLAQLDLQAQQPAAARQRFEDILKADPKHLNAMLAMADLSLREKDEKNYVKWLEKAAAAHPQALQPRVALARHLLARGDKNRALAIAREAVNAQPGNPVALDLLGSTQLALGDTTNALDSYRKLVERQPSQVAPLIKLASAQIVAKDLAGARKTLQDALRIQPDLLDAQLMLGGIDIQGARFDDAHKLANQIQQQKPNSPAGFVLEGDTAFARKDYPAALAAFEHAHKLSPSGAMLVRQLQVLNASQRSEEGEKRLLNWLAAYPQDFGVRAALAENLLKRKQYAAAAEQYLMLNKSNPGNLLVLNNLAWALSEQNDKRALFFAEQALKLNPDNPSVLDTYGWLQVRMGDAAKGLSILKKAQSKAPDSAEIQWHLAYALNANGDKSRARQELKMLLDRNVSFGAEAQAHALYQQLTAIP
jgi:putative PEP-CTERM system TPR-repeat lipoprotein